MSKQSTECDFTLSLLFVAYNMWQELGWRKLRNKYWLLKALGVGWLGRGVNSHSMSAGWFYATCKIETLGDLGNSLFFSYSCISLWKGPQLSLLFTLLPVVLYCILFIKNSLVKRYYYKWVMCMKWNDMKCYWLNYI